MEIGIDQRQASLAYKILLGIYKNPEQAYLKNDEDFNVIVELINQLMTLRRQRDEKPKKKRKRLLIIDVLAELMTIRKVYQAILAEFEDLKLKIEKIESTHSIKLNEKTEKQITDKYNEFIKWNSRLTLMWDQLIEKGLIKE